MRRFLIAGNWKMNGSQKMTAELISGISKGLNALNGSERIGVLVCPPAVYLAEANAALAGSAISLGGQNVSALANGAHTGEVSLPMLNDIGCEYVLLGHSERREIYAESNELVAQKFKACVDAKEASDTGVLPVLCIGETLAQRQSGETEELLGQQLDAVLSVVGIQGLKGAVIAYEPVWAIGTGETATPEQAQAAHQFVRAKLAELDAEVAANVQILYGGSMKAENAKELLSQADIDGGLIGGASLKADSFVAICSAALDVVNEQEN